MLSKTVSTAISALVLVIPVRFTTSLMMSSLIKCAPLASAQTRFARFVSNRRYSLSKPHDRIRFILLSSTPFGETPI